MSYKILLPLLAGFSISAFTSEAQLVNNGASIKIQPGAVIFVAGDVQNNSGTISNDGKLEVQGSFTNNATYSSVASEDSLILSGGGDVNLNGGAAVINYLTVAKTANTNTVKLTGTTQVGKKLDFTSGGFTTDAVANPSFLLTAPITAAFNIAAGREINGKVKRTGWSNGSAVIFNQANMLVSTAGGTNPTDLTVTMLPNGDPTQAEREVKRKFQFAQTGGTGFTADIRFPYQDAELAGTNVEATLVPWQLISSEWNGKLTPVTRDGSANYVATTGITAAEFLNEWKLADARYVFNTTALLKGSWNGSALTTALNTAGIIPLNQPYNTTPFSYTGTEAVAGIPNANIVDWVLVELRKPSSALAEDAVAGTIIGRKAGFLLNTGVIVNTDGVTPISFDINKQGGAFVVVRHRNHLGVISTLTPSNAAGTFTNDFTALAASYKPSGSPSDPVSLLAGGTKYGLWSGDANKNGVVNVLDINAIKFAIGNSATGYQFTDVNLTANINVLDVNAAKGTVGSSGTGSGAKKQLAVTNIPDPVNTNE